MPEVIFNGPDGRLEGRYHHYTDSDGPMAMILHPHPQHGGTMNNRVVYELFQIFKRRGFSVLRFNFRGVGGSAGTHDEGRGEAEDFLEVVRQAAPEGPLALAGFSFGAFVTCHALARLWGERAIERVVLVGTAASRFAVAPVPPEAHERTLVVHGEQDDTVPLASWGREWAEFLERFQRYYVER